MGQVGPYPQQLGVNPQAGNAMRLAGIERRLRQVENQAGFIANGAITGSTTAPGDPTTVTAPGLIRAGAITTAEILTGTITTTNMYAGAVTAKLLQANNIAAGAIVAGHIAAGAIDAMVITGATVRTSAGSTRVQMDATGIYALAAGVVTFAADAATGKITTLAGLGGGNLLKNSSAEAALTVGGYLPIQCTVAAAASSITRHGANVFRLTSTVASEAVLYNVNDRIPVVGGETYSASGYVRPATTARAVHISIVWYNGGTQVGTTFGANINETAGAWTRATASGQAPTTATRAEIYWVINTAAVGEVHDWDALQFEQGQLPTAYKPKEDEVLPATITGSAGSGEIAPGAVTGPDVYAGVTTSFLIQANNIAAGAITAGKIAAGAIDAMTITGATVRTAASGARVELSGSSLKSYDASNNVVFDIAASQPAPIMWSGIGNGYTQAAQPANTFVTWTGTTQSVYVPSGKTLMVLGGGVAQAPAGGGVAVSFRAFVGLIPGPTQAWTISSASGYASPVGSAMWQNGGAGGNVNVGLQWGNVANSVDIIASRGWMIALVF